MVIERRENLQATRAAIIAKMEDALHAGEGRDFSDEEQATYNGLERELRENDLAAELRKENDRKASAAWRGMADFNPGAKSSGRMFDTFSGGEGVARRGAKTYAALFGQATLSTDGWASFDDFLTTLHSGQSHPQFRMAAGEGVGSDGGFLVPEQFAARILDSALEDEIVRPRADVWPMQTDTLKVAGVDASDSSSDLFGGISGQWIGESGTISLEDISFKKVELHARKLAVLTKASNEIREDGISFEQQLEETLRQAVSWYMDYAFLRGTGVGQPLGALNDPAKVEVSKETGQVADTIVYANLCKMLARLHPRCFGNSLWIASPSCIPQLLQLSVIIGVGGSHVPVLQQTDGGFTVLTRPVVFSEKLPTIGDAGDIILADFSQYAIGIRRQMTLDKSGHVYFTTDETGYRAIVRVDGMGKWSAAYTPKNGDSQSWVVSLAAR